MEVINMHHGTDFLYLMRSDTISLFITDNCCGWRVGVQIINKRYYVNFFMADNIIKFFIFEESLKD